MVSFPLILYSNNATLLNVQGNHALWCSHWMLRAFDVAAFGKDNNQWLKKSKLQLALSVSKVSRNVICLSVIK